MGRRGRGKPRPYKSLPQRLPFQELHGDEGLALVPSDLVDRADIGVVQSRGRPGLALKPLQCLMVLGEPFRQELEGDKAVELDVLGLVDHTHSAAAEFFQDAIVGNRLASHARNPELHLGAC